MPVIGTGPQDNPPIDKDAADRRPDDTLGSENAARTTRPQDFDPGEDAGSAQPSGNPKG